MRSNYLVRVLTRPNVRIRTYQPARSLCSAPSTADVELKNVTKSNFDATLAELRRHVREADFVSIDLEMSGITSTPWRDSFEFDRPDIQYLKTKDSASKFAVVQFGVCPFRWDPLSSSFVAHPHNFFIFPRQEIGGDGLSREFLCQTSSLEFLAKYQFDFNTCINEGISYLSRRQEEEALKCLDSAYKDERKGSDTKPVKMSDLLFSERMKNVVGEWRAGLLGGRNWGSEFQGSPNVSNEKFQTTFFQTRPALVVNGLTSRQLKLIKLVTEKHFNDLAYVHVTDESSGRLPLIVYTDSANDRDLLKGEVKACQRKAAETSIRSAIGFRHVIDLLSSEKKLIVGHNCFLDLAHVYSKFIGPLPSTAEEFVSALQTYFPSIIDTKVLLNSEDVLMRIMKKGGTSLAKAFTSLCLRDHLVLTSTSTELINKRCTKVEVQVDDKRFSNWNSGAKHEAGYDAFMTGCVFSEACFRLGIGINSQAPGLNLQDNEKLQKYINHLYLSWVNGDIIDLKTGKSSPDTLGSATAKRRPTKFTFSNMVLLWRLPAKLKSKDIRECLDITFGYGSIISVTHVDESAVFVQFSKPKLVSHFLEMKDSLERDSKNPISVVHPLWRILQSGCVRAATYETYKEVCRSSLSEVLFADQAEKIGIKGAAGVGTDEEEGKTNVFRVSEDKKQSSVRTNDDDKHSSSKFQTDQIIKSLYPSAAQLSS